MWLFCCLQNEAPSSGRKIVMCSLCHITVWCHPSFLLFFAGKNTISFLVQKTLMLDLYCKRRPWTQELKPRRLLTWCKSKMTLQHFGDIERKLKSHLDSFLQENCTKNSAIFWSAKVLSRIFKGILLLSQCLKTNKKSHFFRDPEFWHFSPILSF